MKKKKIVPAVLTTALLLAVIAPHAVAQKLPKIQETSIWAPADTRADGKLTEWNDQFQAYNPAEYLYYTLANNDTHLFLAARMTTENGTRKILAGGLTLTIGRSANDPKAVSVRFPAQLAQSGPLGFKFPDEDLLDAPRRYTGLRKDSVTNRSRIDLLVAQGNKDIKSLFKNVQVTGVATISNPLLSIYNQEGIRAAAILNERMEYICEFAIPLKYLGDELVKGGKIAYTITIHSDDIPVKGVPGRPVFGGPNADPVMVYRTHPTYFSGGYTLATGK